MRLRLDLLVARRGRGTRDPPTVPGSARPRRICSGSVALYHGQAGIPRAADSIGAAAPRRCVKPALSSRLTPAKPVRISINKNDHARHLFVDLCVTIESIPGRARAANLPPVFGVCFFAKGSVESTHKVPPLVPTSHYHTKPGTDWRCHSGRVARWTNTPARISRSGPPTPIHRHRHNTVPRIPCIDSYIGSRHRVPHSSHLSCVEGRKCARARRKRNNLSDVSLVESWNLWVRVRCC